MDPQLRKRLLTEVTVFPFDKIIRGEKTFKPSYTLRAYVLYKDQYRNYDAGSKWKAMTSLIIEAHSPTQDLVSHLSGQVVRGGIIPLEPMDIQVHGENAYCTDETKAKLDSLAWEPCKLNGAVLTGLSRLHPIQEDAEYELFRLGLGDLSGQYVVGPSRAQQVQFSNVKQEDEIQLHKDGKRFPVAEVRTYQGLNRKKLELQEVYLGWISTASY